MLSQDEVTEIALARLRAGGERSDAEMELVSRGYTRAEAYDLVSEAVQIHQAERHSTHRQAGNFEILGGLIIGLAGLGMMIHSYVQTGTRVLIPVGLFVIGALVIIDGLSRR